MKEKNIKTYTEKRLDKMIARGEDKTDWARLRSMTDSEIDTSDIPEMPPGFWKDAILVIPRKKKSLLTVRLDTDLLDWLRRQGKGYQTKINAILRYYMDAQLHKPRSGKSRHT